MFYKWLGIAALALTTTCLTVFAQADAPVTFTSAAVEWRITAPSNYTGDGRTPAAFLNVAADADGHIYVANYSSVLIYDAETGRLEDAIRDGSGTLRQYDDVEAAGDGKVWVADSKTHSVYLLDADGSILQTIPSITPDNSDAELSPNELALGHDGNLYVLYSSINTVMQVFTPAGEFLRSFMMGDRSLSSGLIDFAVGPDGNLYIAGGGTIRVLDAEGNIVVKNFAQEFLQASSIGVQGIAVDADGTVYFGGNSYADDGSLVAAVYKVDGDGNLRAQFGKAQPRINWSTEFKPEELAYTVSLALLPEGQVVISDLNSGYVQLLKVDMTTPQ